MEPRFHKKPLSPESSVELDYLPSLSFPMPRNPPNPQLSLPHFAYWFLLPGSLLLIFCIWLSQYFTSIVGSKAHNKIGCLKFTISSLRIFSKFEALMWTLEFLHLRFTQWYSYSTLKERSKVVSNTFEKEKTKTHFFFPRCKTFFFFIIQ